MHNLLEQILSYLEQKGIEIISSNDEEIITLHQIQNTKIKIKGKYNQLEKNKLPIYYLCDRKNYGILAHIGWSEDEDIGLCCSGSDDVLSLNYYEPQMVYYEGLLKTIDLIRPTIHDPEENYKQIMSEYLGHLNWVEDDNISPILFIGEYKPSVTPLKLYKPSGQVGFHKNIIVTNNGIDGNTINNQSYCVIQTLKKSNILGSSFLIELNNSSLPPIPNDNLKDWWINLITLQNSDFLENLTAIANKKKSNQFYFVCYFKYEEEIFNFCICCKSKTGKQYAPLDEKLIRNWNISIVKIIQHTKEYLLPRSGSTLNFQDKKVLLVGCGSVGSNIERQLIQSGIGELILSDPDVFKVENLYRHTLSVYSLNTYKSHALKSSLSFEYPYTTIESYIYELMDIPKDLLSKQDLIIVAIGNATQERVFNEYLKDEKLNVPTIYTWLEGYGLGGHVVFVDTEMEKGCLQCNYMDPNSEEPILHSNMNFLYPNQNVTKDMGGCGTLFLPYSHLDSEQTATMVSRMSIDVLNNNLNKSARISWKGPSFDAEQQRLELTHRYYKYKSPTYEEYQQESCFVCK